MAVYAMMFMGMSLLGRSSAARSPNARRAAHAGHRRVHLYRGGSSSTSASPPGSSRGSHRRVRMRPVPSSGSHSKPGSNPLETPNRGS
jgi:hypothetical protein